MSHTTSESQTSVAPGSPDASKKTKPPLPPLPYESRGAMGGDPMVQPRKAIVKKKFGNENPAPSGAENGVRKEYRQAPSSRIAICHVEQNPVNT